jgi:hypothetical protein
VASALKSLMKGAGPRRPSILQLQTQLLRADATIGLAVTAASAAVTGAPPLASTLPGGAAAAIINAPAGDATALERIAAHSLESAVTAGAATEMILGLPLGTINVGEGLGERSLVTALELDTIASRAAEARAKVAASMSSSSGRAEDKAAGEEAAAGGAVAASAIHYDRVGAEGSGGLASIAADIDRVLKPTGGVNALGTIGALRARTKDQPGLWREVTAVAAEPTCLLCLHK